jgi:hypothetical protein
MIKKSAGAFLQLSVGVLALALLLASCRGSSNPNDVVPGGPLPAVIPVAGPDGFLLFPNPQSGPGIDSITDDKYANAYYAAIDKYSERTNLQNWKTKNGFGSTSRPGSEVEAVFGDVRDLGYGRYVYARYNDDDKTYAFYVDNY